MNEERGFKEIARDIVEKTKNYKFDYEEIDYDKMYGQGSKVLLEGKFMGIEIRIIFHGKLGNPCAYFKIPDENKRLKDMILWEGYDAIPYQTVHWGFTFGRKLKGEDLRSDGVRLGWDYGHCDDYVSYHKEYGLNYEHEKKRTVEEILVQIIEQILVFKDKRMLD